MSKIKKFFSTTFQLVVFYKTKNIKTLLSKVYPIIIGITIHINANYINNHFKLYFGNADVTLKTFNSKIMHEV